MTHEMPSAQAWFASGERIGYDSDARVARAKSGR